MFTLALFISYNGKQKTKTNDWTKRHEASTLKQPLEP